MSRPGDGKLRLVDQSRPTAVWGGEVSPERSHTDPLSCCRRAPEPRRRGPSSPQSPQYLLRGPFQRRCRCPFYAAVSRCDCLVGVHVCGWLQGAPRRRRHAHRQPQDLLWLEARPGGECHGVEGGRSCSSPGASPAASGPPACPREDGVATAPPQVALPCLCFHVRARTARARSPHRVGVSARPAGRGRGPQVSLEEDFLPAWSPSPMQRPCRPVPDASMLSG